MKKQSSALIANNLPHSRAAETSSASLFETHPLMDWLLGSGKKLLYGILGSFVILFILSLWLLRSNGEASRGYFDALSDYQLFEKATSAEKQTTTLSQLSQVLTDFPDLHAYYDGNIAQILINRNQVEQAKPFAAATLRRTLADRQVNYRAYSETSLAIAEKNFQPALSQSLELKQKLMAAQDKTQLAIFNLLRTAFLYNALGDHANELQAWQAWLAASHAPGFSDVSALFVDGKLALSDYIKARIEALEGKNLPSTQQKLQ